MTHAEQLAAFVVRASYDDLSEAARQQLKIRVLDSLGCAIGALDGEPIHMVRAQVDEFGGAQMQVLGVSTCGKGADTSYHLVYLVGLGDPTSTLPADRFLGTYELTQEDGTWAIGATYVGLYTDWQLVLDDPLTQIACGDIQPWVGAAPNLNPPQSESQPTPIAATGSP